MIGSTSPTRRGVCVYLTLDFDVVEILEALAPGPRSRGRYLSELLRTEMARREERQRLRAALQPVCQDEPDGQT